MRTYVQHDSDGVIHAIITVDAPEGVRAGMDIGPRLSMSEIEFSDLRAPTTESDVEEIVRTTREYRLSVPAETTAKLLDAK